MKNWFIALLLLAAIGTGCDQNLADKVSDTTLSADSTSIYYERVGNGKAPVVLIHGWCIDHSYWDSTVNALKDEYTVLTLGLAGHGQSGGGREDYTIPLFSEDVIAAMDAAGIAKGILVSHSMAGSIMLAVNEKAPQRVIGLIGVDNFKDLDAPHNDSTNRDFDNFIRQMRSGYEAMSSKYVSQYLFTTEADSQHKSQVLNSVLTTPKDVSISALENLYAYSKDNASRLAGLDKPLQLITSDYSPTDTAALDEYMGDNYAHYEMTCPGHYPMIQRPVAFHRNLQVAIESLNY